MTIWIDFINSPQVSFFDPLINALIGEGHEIILTCRDAANTVDLIKQREWAYKIIGKDVKKTTIKKFLSAPGRILTLYFYLRKKNIDVAISQSSFYLPFTARLLGVPSIYTNDNEHALGNIPAFLFAKKIFLPEFFSIERALKRGAARNKIHIYPGIKEGIYLWQKGQQIRERRVNNTNSLKRIFVRPEPSTAQYYSGKENFLDDLLIRIKDQYSVTILTRDDTQRRHYREAQFSGIEVPEQTLHFDEIAVNCSLFIGAGGSMTREMAIMNIPTISVYQDELLGVDKFLITENFMRHFKTLCSEDVENILNKKSFPSGNEDLVEKGKVAYTLIRNTILNLKKK